MGEKRRNQEGRNINWLSNGSVPGSVRVRVGRGSSMKLLYVCTIRSTVLYWIVVSKVVSFALFLFMFWSTFIYSILSIERTRTLLFLEIISFFSGGFCFGERPLPCICVFWVRDFIDVPCGLSLLYLGENFAELYWLLNSFLQSEKKSCSSLVPCQKPDELFSCRWVKGLISNIQKYVYYLILQYEYKLSL